MKKNWIYIVILVVVLGGAFFAALKYLKSSKAQNNQTADANGQNSPGQNGRFGRGGNRGNFTPLHGTISGVSDSTIVMKTDDGSSKNITTTSDTRIMKMDNGERSTLALSDLKVGDEINVMTEDSSQNPIAARMIFIGTFSPPANRGQWQGGGTGGNLQEENSDNSSSNQI